MSINPTYLQNLKDRNLKITGARKALLDVMSQHPEPFTVEKLEQHLHAAGQTVHRATVYRDIDMFVKNGILRELAIQGTPAHYYELITDHHHHYFVCTQCFSLTSIVLDVVEQALSTYERSVRKQGMEVSSHSIKLYGLCPQCSKQEN